jgi:DNA repair ATPase RecN
MNKQTEIFISNLMVAITLECFENENMMLEGLVKQKQKQDVKTMINIARRLLAPVRAEHEEVLTEVSDSLQDVLNEIRAKLREIIEEQLKEEEERLKKLEQGISKKTLEIENQLAAKFKIGDRIKDIEDGDCYYEGIVTQLNPLKYKVDKIIWNGEEFNEDPIGREIELKWYLIEKVNATN